MILRTAAPKIPMENRHSYSSCGSDGDPDAKNSYNYTPESGMVLSSIAKVLKEPANDHLLKDETSSSIS